jgi:hypothetical protein
MILILYIDDFFETKDDIDGISWLEKELKTKFDVMSLGLYSSTLEFNFHIRTMVCCFIKPIMHLTSYMSSK